MINLTEIKFSNGENQWICDECLQILHLFFDVHEVAVHWDVCDTGQCQNCGRC